MSASSATAGSQETQTPRLLSVVEAAERMNVGERFIRRLIFERRIPFTKLGTHVRIAETDVDEFIRANRVEAEAE